MFFKRLGAAGNKTPTKRFPKTPLRRDATSLEQFIVEEIEIGDVRSPVAAIPLSRAKSSAGWSSIKSALAYTGLWLLLIMATLFARTIWPVDETRLLAVAWEMWTRNEFVLPYLNGELFTRQPPLMPWLIHAGWGLLGVNDWWPRLLPALFALASLFVTGRLARLLWRDNLEISRFVPLVLVGTPLWAVYTSLALPDMLLAFFTLLGWWAVLIMWRHRDMRAFLLLGAALGLGALALGLVIYVYVLPVALLAPLWGRGLYPIVWKYWYADVTKAILLGLAILLLWLAPAALHAGLPYALRWLYGSLIAARLDLLPAAQPWWWYLPWWPIVCLPWTIWPLLWLRLWHIRREPLSAGMNFCLIGTVATLVALSFIDVKQPQFLLPLLPLAALFVSHLLLDESLGKLGQDTMLGGMTIPIVVLGGVLAILPKLPRVEFLPGPLWELSPFVGIGIMIAGIALAWIPGREIRRRAVDIIIAGTLLVVFATLGVGWQFDSRHQLDAVGRFLATAQAQHRPIAHVGDYQGEFQFSGRLLEPLQTITPDQAESWSATRPHGMLVSFTHIWQPRGADTMRPALETAHRGLTLRIWYAGVDPVQHP